VKAARRRTVEVTGVVMVGWWLAAMAVTCPVRLESADPRAAGPAVIVVDKSARWLGLYRDGGLVTVDGAPLCARVALAPGASVGTKEREGDRRTPEGWYRTSDKPTSSFAGAIAVHYPSAEDAARGLAAGLVDAPIAAQIRAAEVSGRKPPQATALGGEILIHGGGSTSDWTLGCVALEDADLARLRAALPAGMAAWAWIRP
jgi:murein L,D-transpeptidase YafK